MRTGTGARGLCPSPPSHWAPGGRITTQQAAPPPSPLSFQSTPPPRGRTTRGAPAREAEGPCGRWAFSLGSCTATSLLPGPESYQTPRFKQRLLRTDGSARGEKREAVLPLRSKIPRASRRVPRLPGAQTPDFAVVLAGGAGWRGRRGRGEARDGARAPARSPLLPPALASPRRVTAALRLQRGARPPARDSWAGVGAWRFKIRSRWTPVAALLEGDDAPLPLPARVPSFAEFPDP